MTEPWDDTNDERKKLIDARLPDDGYGQRYWTGKDCIIAGCIEPAGTGWGPLWCKKHDIERRNRVTAQMEDLLRQFDNL